MEKPNLTEILKQAKEDPASLLPPCKNAVCLLPIGCCQNEFGISEAILYMKRAGLTIGQIVEAFQEAYGNKGLSKGRYLARSYLGGQ